ncbi:MAG: hypothetical protein CVU43_06275 [Chloroflexi bacterium HGW-Chloroflexi-5]|nr:MAG: hypothetical protein CVU43_06275 [Chloroflexi bacterium HGW-Chloroflexi-5]
MVFFEKRRTKLFELPAPERSEGYSFPIFLWNKNESKITHFEIGFMKKNALYIKTKNQSQLFSIFFLPERCSLATKRLFSAYNK